MNWCWNQLIEQCSCTINSYGNRFSVFFFSFFSRSFELRIDWFSISLVSLINLRLDRRCKKFLLFVVRLIKICWLINTIRNSCIHSHIYSRIRLLMCALHGKPLRSHRRFFLYIYIFFCFSYNDEKSKITQALNCHSFLTIPKSIYRVFTLRKTEQTDFHSFSLTVSTVWLSATDARHRRSNEYENTDKKSKEINKMKSTNTTSSTLNRKIPTLHSIFVADRRSVIFTFSWYCGTSNKVHST